MKFLIRYRVLIIAAFFALVGIALSVLVKVEELRWYYISLAPLLAVLVGFLILFLLKKESSKRILGKLKSIAVAFFAAFIIGLFFYISLFNRSTFQFVHANGKATYHIKGNKTSYSEAALAFKKQNPGISDDELIRLGFVNPDNKKWAWSEDSIKKNSLSLVIGYCILIVLLAAFLSFISESLAQKSVRNKLLLYDENEDDDLHVFISYSHRDKEVADGLSAMLQKEKIKVIIDSASMLAGEDIKQFIDRAILSSGVTVSIISKDSLLSNWVSFETVGTFFIERFSNSKRFIAAYLDNDFLDPAFTSEAINSLNAQLEKIKKLISDRDALRIDTRDLNDDKSRLLFLINNLDEIIHRMRTSLCVDITKEKLQANFPVLLKSIKNAAEVINAD